MAFMSKEQVRRFFVGKSRELGATAEQRAATRRFQASARGKALAAFKEQTTSSIFVGKAASTGQSVYLSPKQLVGTSRWTTGATGAGKSAQALAELLSLIRPKSMSPLVVVDGKSELAPQLSEIFLPATVGLFSEAERKKFCEQLLVLRPFAGGALPPLNILTPVARVAPALQAKEIVVAVTESLGESAQVGLRMETILLYTLRLALAVGDLSLLEVRELLTNREYLSALVRTIADEELRSYFVHRFPKERPDSIQALTSRLDLLLLAPSAKRALCARGSIDVPAMLEGGMTIIDVGSPPRGAEYLGQFWMGVMFRALARAVMGRELTKQTPPAFLLVDEWQTGLDATLAAHMERVLTLSRFKRVSWHLLNQLPAQIGAKHPALLATLKNSCAFQVAFRQSYEDARPLSHLVVPEEGEKPSDAVAALTRLPKRHFLWAARGLGHVAIELVAPTVDFRGAEQAAQKASSELREACATGSNPGFSVAELDAVIKERHARIAGMSGRVEKIVPSKTKPAPLPSKVKDKLSPAPVTEEEDNGFPSLG